VPGHVRITPSSNEIATCRRSGRQERLD
jgi:hypothetical protein